MLHPRDRGIGDGDKSQDRGPHQQSNSGATRAIPAALRCARNILNLSAYHLTRWILPTRGHRDECRSAVELGPLLCGSRVERCFAGCRGIQIFCTSTNSRQFPGPSLLTGGLRWCQRATELLSLNNIFKLFVKNIFKLRLIRMMIFTSTELDGWVCLPSIIPKAQRAQSEDVIGVHAQLQCLKLRDLKGAFPF
jgi:hypothetical protein